MFFNSFEPAKPEPLTDSFIATTLDEIEAKIGHARGALETKSYNVIKDDMIAIDIKALDLEKRLITKVGFSNDYLGTNNFNMNTLDLGNKPSESTAAATPTPFVFGSNPSPKSLNFAPSHTTFNFGEKPATNL